MNSVTDLADSFTGDVLADTQSFLEGYTVNAIGPLLLAVFGIVVAFVAYKLIKRAINKA